MAKEIDIREFAERVERLCEFIFEQAPKDGSMDLKVIMDLREDAADIQNDNRSLVPLTLKGLDDHMRGLPEKKET